MDKWVGLNDNDIDIIYEKCTKVFYRTDTDKLGNDALDNFMNSIRNSIQAGIYETQKILRDKNG